MFMGLSVFGKKGQYSPFAMQDLFLNSVVHSGHP